MHRSTANRRYGLRGSFHWQSLQMILGAAPANDFSAAVTLTLWVAGLAIVTTICVYVVGKFRGGFRESDLGPSNLITNFRELHSQGELSDEEYRNIKSKLAAQMQEELKKSKKPEVEFDEFAEFE